MFQEIPKNCRYAYAKINSKSEKENSSLESQKKEFLVQGVPEKNIRIEISCADDEIVGQPVFEKLVEEELQENDLLVVSRMDDCSETTGEFLKFQEKLFKKKVSFVSLDLPYSADMGVNKLIARNLVAIASFENKCRKKREARKGGKPRGRKTVITKEFIAEVKNLKESKNLSIKEIAKVTGKGRNTIYKVLKEHLGYVSNRLVKQEDKKGGNNESK